MRRTRNPRYAPEFLERKLSPSSVGAPVAAEVYTPTATDPSDPPPPPTDDNGDPPLDPVGYPEGPGGPA